MTPARAGLGREDVLGAFAMEDEHGRSVLDRYLRDYPQFAGDLIDLSRELMREAEPGDDAPLSAAGQARLDAAWNTHVAARPTAADPFASFTPAMGREVAGALGVPRQVITCFRERRVLLGSVPRTFMKRLAESMGAAVGPFLEALAMPPTSAQARSYKADGKPGAVEQVTFERILIDAGVPEAKRAELLAEDA